MTHDANTQSGIDLVGRFLCCVNTAARGWVYLVQTRDRVKIGSASSYQGVRRQLTSAQTYAAYGIDRVALIHGGQARETELHRRFDAERLRFDGPHITAARTFRSEWFCGPASRTFLAELRIDDECESCASEQLTLFSWGLERVV